MPLVKYPAIKYHGKDGLTHSIAVHDQEDAVGADGYLTINTQPDKTQNNFKLFYIPIVPVAHGAASDVAIYKDGTPFRLKKYGSFVGAYNKILDQTSYAGGPRDPNSTGWVAIDGQAGITEVSDSYNLRLTINTWWRMKFTVLYRATPTSTAQVLLNGITGSKHIFEGAKDHVYTVRAPGGEILVTGQANDRYTGLVHFKRWLVEVWR